MVACDDLLDDVINSDNFTWSRGIVLLGYLKLVAIDFTVEVGVVAIVRSEGAHLLYYSCVPTCKLNLIPLIFTRSNHDDHLLTCVRQFGSGICTSLSE